VDVLNRVRVLAGPSALRRWAVASLVANILIVVTGALVRLTASGLGCPTWPRCTDDSYVAHPALGLHGAIEFGNRLLTFVLAAVALLTWIAALLHRDPDRLAVRGGRRRDLRWLAGGMALGIPAQAVIGGISVLTQLNPYVVALHLLASFALVGLAVGLVRATRDVQPVRVPGALPVVLVRLTFAAMVLAVWLGTVVTGSGPHAGDELAIRNGLNGALVTHLHAGAVYLTVALTVLCLWLVRSRAVALLLAVEVLQAALGLTQYRLGLPIGLVALHLLGASLAVAAATNLLLDVRAALPGSGETLRRDTVSPAAADPAQRFV
jgi:cytochrome c oxidase assembly protein subunit 15